MNDVTKESVPIEVKPSNKMLIFISHRTADKELANTLKTNLESWGIPTDRIFQSSHPDTGIKSGDEIKKSLEEHLRRTDLFLMVYTAPDQDWSYCNWELGVATASDTKETRVVCFSCANEPPRLMVESLMSRINFEDISKFTKEMHYTESFLISDEATAKIESPLIEALKGTASGAVENRSLTLFEQMKEKAPSGEVKTFHRWDYLKFYMEPAAIRAIRELGDDSSQIERQYELVRKTVQVVEGSQNDALRAFGYQVFEDGINLKRLKERWRSEIREKRQMKSNEDPNLDWAKDLYGDVIRAIFNRRAQRTFNYLESIAIEQPTFFRPAVVKAKRLLDDAMEFDVYLYRLGANEMQLIDALEKSKKS